MWKRSLIVLVFFFNVAQSQLYFPNEGIAIPNYGRCSTPNRERALCVRLEDCQYLFNMLFAVPLRDSDKLYLSRSQCGFQNDKVLICCPDRYVQNDVVAQRMTSESTSQIDLLPKPGQCGNVLSNRIYGGNLTKIDEFPWMALLEYNKGDGRKGHHCGGSLISKLYVLTASHCVNGKDLPIDWKLSTVRLGEWDLLTSPDCEVDVRGDMDCAPLHLDIAIESAIPHPQYVPSSRNQVNDIAVLRMERSVEYTDFIRPICLPVDMGLRSATFDGISMDVAGWGKTEFASSSSLKLKASVDGVPLDDCINAYSSQKIYLENTQMCAGGKEGIDSCRGDSGGALVSLDTTNRVRAYYFIAGVVSFGPNPCALQGWPGVYTRVGHYVDWIRNTIQP